jgi:hypothetical protein
MDNMPQDNTSTLAGALEKVVDVLLSHLEHPPAWPGVFGSGGIAAGDGGAAEFVTRRSIEELLQLQQNLKAQSLLTPLTEKQSPYALLSRDPLALRSESASAANGLDEAIDDHNELFDAYFGAMFARRFAPQEGDHPEEPWHGGLSLFPRPDVQSATTPTLSEPTVPGEQAGQASIDALHITDAGALLKTIAGRPKADDPLASPMEAAPLAVFSGGQPTSQYVLLTAAPSPSQPGAIVSADAPITDAVWTRTADGEYTAVQRQEVPSVTSPNTWKPAEATQPVAEIPAGTGAIKIDESGPAGAATEPPRGAPGWTPEQLRQLPPGLAVGADGSVRTIGRDIDSHVLEQLRQGGQLLSEPAVHGSVGDPQSGADITRPSAAEATATAGNEASREHARQNVEGFASSAGKSLAGLAVGVGTAAAIGTVSPLAATVVAIAGAAYGGYKLGQSIYEGVTGHEVTVGGSPTGRQLTDRERSERAGEAVVGLAAIGAGVWHAVAERVPGPPTPQAGSGMPDGEESGTALKGTGKPFAGPSEPSQTATITGRVGDTPGAGKATGTTTLTGGSADAEAVQIGKNTRGIWDLTPEARWTAVENQLGKNLPSNYPVIDKFENGIATSIKSMDLGAPTYANAEAITRVGHGYIDKLAEFQPRPWAGVRIEPGEIQGRNLDLAVPPGATTAQQQALQSLIQYGRERGLTVNIVETH